MKTVNISLPDSMANQIDLLLGQEEYVSRSEVVRTALRIFFTLDQREESVELQTFKKRPLSEIASEMKKAGNSKKNIDSIIDGLSKSSLYSS